jgi:opacity protein-like surface antigen
MDDGPMLVAVPEPPPKPARKRWRPKWGLNLHLEGALMGGSRKRDPDSGMAGLGFSLRYRPIPHFALDTGLDFIGGVDWQGYDRRETALLVNAMVFFNPKNAVQFYMLGGVGFSGATVRLRDVNGNAVSGTERDYSYFGGQLGLGLEFRVTHRVSLNLDVIGFVRGRTDEGARYAPEFTDTETGRTTNSSGGGLMRGGITFYW